MQWVMSILSSVCLLGGVVFLLAAAIGLVRLPDLYCRAHAVAKAMTLGIILLLTGLWLGLEKPDAGCGLKIALAVLFQFLTIPVASHLLGLAAWRRKLPRWRERPPFVSSQGGHLTDG